MFLFWIKNNGVADFWDQIKTPVESLYTEKHPAFNVYFRKYREQVTVISLILAIINCQLVKKALAV